ncbi:hypothetical protein Bca52824_059922 [Brassica carinata]|uniref:Cyclin N-terminal domain-containing protein n=1 Tax=Brassica carinata TaxID=52824 RepID=A0A8X7UG14_BRACI|nr:hypothetical protein Bca52824_059922 [Brassica carinata]
MFGTISLNPSRWKDSNSGQHVEYGQRPDVFRWSYRGSKEPSCSWLHRKHRFSSPGVEAGKLNRPLNRDFVPSSLKTLTKRLHMIIESVPLCLITKQPINVAKKPEAVQKKARAVTQTRLLKLNRIRDTMLHPRRKLHTLPLSMLEARTLDIDSADKDNDLGAVEYVEDMYAFYKEVELLGVSALLIASKYEEIWPPQNKQILVMEKTILGSLEWYLTVPTQYVFLARFIKATNPDPEMENMVHFLADLSDAQRGHALDIERHAPRLAALRIELFYFVLLLSRLNKHNAQLSSSPQVIQARALWMK